MAELTKAFIERLAATCSIPNRFDQGGAQRDRRSSDNIKVLSTRSYPQKLEKLRARLLDLADEMTELRQHTACEWFLDNFYLIAETAQTLHEDLPASFYRKLPVLEIETGARVQRLPRVYVLAEELVGLVSKPPDRELLERFLCDLQDHVPLDIGELWAFPAMLRAVCLERLVDQLTELLVIRAEEEPASLASDSDGPDQVSFAVRTLIELKTIPWRQVFEHCSLVHKELLRDPAGVYAQMDFSTCDRYRKAVEQLAHGAGRDELSVAAEAIAVASAADDAAVCASGQGDPLRGHVGYHLIDRGRPDFEGALHIRATRRVSFGRGLRRFATPVYLTSIAAATLAVLALLATYLWTVSASPLAIGVACAIALVPSSTFAIAWVQWVITNLIEPKRLPRLALDKGIDPENRSLVVIPTLFGDVEEVHDLIQRLELHYLANPDPNLGFAILADYTDAFTYSTPGDESLLARARGGIDLLNQRYREKGGRGPFHLLVRERRLNASEGVWMGWERKRGKLEEFNRLLAGSRETSYSIHVGQSEGLVGIRFVITLDSDTELPRDAARRLVATLAHPLNRAHFEGDRLSSGYTVLQPRLDISPEASHRSRFSRIFAGDTGLDIYSRAVSNVYQDFFGSGVYVGKGIYDVDAFRRCLEGRVPENALLSHDLFEGIYGRAGLVTDVVLYEDYPPSYLSYARRLHRWIRGDWQLLPWLRRRVPSEAGPRIANPFSKIDRWKLADNLRRSLLPLSLLAMLLSGWTWLPGHPAIWTALTLVLSAGHLLTGLASRLRGFFGRPLRLVGRSFSDVPNDLYRWLLSLAFLPHEAVIVTDAVLRTIMRMAFTRRRLLEWTTAAHTANLLARRGQRSLQWWEMLGGPLCALAVAAMVLAFQPTAIGPAVVFVVLWLVSPEIALFLVKPEPTETEELEPEQAQLLRQLSRRTWLFFETFVGPDDHWLPPDNVQLVPRLRIAHRTSPTNIGLYLASCASAYDLGYLGLRGFCVRVQSTLRTLDQLERHRGQLLNWYETQTLEPLLPRYVSTVDNGNFAAALMAVRQACGDFATAPMFRRQSFAALGDVIDLLTDCVAGSDGGVNSPIGQTAREMREAIAEAAKHPDRWLLLVEKLETHVEDLSKSLETRLEQEGAASSISVEYEALDWLEVLTREVYSMRDSIELLAGWYYTLSTPPPGIAGHARQRAALFALREECFGASFEQMLALGDKLETFLGACEIHSDDELGLAWARKVREQFGASITEAEALLGEALDVGVSCEMELAKIDFSFLYDTEANQMFIGYDASSSQPDHHHYDLLASEARLASLVAIALDQVPTKHWAHLGRPVSSESMLLSWSGTMFEYLMPLLFTRSFPKTLLGRSTSGAIQRQIQYGRKRKVPWGVSESAFASTDARGDYQYRAFGAPGLGLKRGLEEDLVVAPYASILAVGLKPVAVVENLIELRKLGAWGEYGAMEAVDFTAKRSRPMGLVVPATGDRGSGMVVQAYMAHHQGMSMVAIGNLLAGESMIERFHADPRVQTVANLLQEKLPETATKLEFSETPHVALHEFPVDRVVFPEPWSPSAGTGRGSISKRLVDPSLHVLSNGSLNLLCDSFGRSRLWVTHGHEEIDVRPREPGASQDRAGSFCLYLEPEGQGSHLISGGLAAGAETRTNNREVIFWPHKVESRAHFESLATLEEVFIAPHDNVEIRRLRLTNEGAETAAVGVTGYAEISLQRAEEHHRHPAFSRLFLQTTALESGRILICQRRPRGPNERFPVVAQAVLAPDSPEPGNGHRDWVTSRLAFIGRGGSLDDPRWPVSDHASRAPSGDGGHALDPCLAQRIQLSLAPGESQSVAWVTAVGIDEERALEALLPYLQLSSLSVIHDQSARASAQRLGQSHLTALDVALFQHLYSRLVHRSEPTSAGAIRNRLWGHGISGDLPILILHRRSEETQLVQQLLRAHHFFAEQNVLWDLVFLVHDASGYVDEAREQIRRLARSLDHVDLHPNVSIVSAGQLQPGDLKVLEAAAGTVLDSEAGDLSEQLSRATHQPKTIPLFIPTRSAEVNPATTPLERRSELLYDNGLGGFDRETNEYLLFLGGEDSDAKQRTQTPAPWCNVLSNPSFGTLVSERGFGCTWARNASENRLTPWSNDAVCDPPSEAVYWRDEETAEVWSPTPGPMASTLPYEVAHGIGYSRFRHRSHGLMQTVNVFVHAQEPVKFVELLVENLTDRPRRMTTTYFADWVLGGRSATHGKFVTASFDPDARAIVAENPWAIDFPEQAAFLASSEKVHGFTVDPLEFLGIGGPSDPDALRQWGLSNSERSGALSCAALQVHVDLGPRQSQRLHFALGWGETREQAISLAMQSTRGVFLAQASAGSQEHWREILERVVISTPDPATDLMLNSWALYQTVSSRLYARAGFYQSSGAIGYRDQLQDVMSLTAVLPTLAREHILAAAAHQFAEGDVLHWWHPPKGQGVRTRCSDDLLWLPYAVARYVETTGDETILDEQVAFLTGAELLQDEHDHYAVFEQSSESASVYQHCLRALDRGYALGPQELPLMGGGDWNDGMNLVGAEGRGESVWLGWFLYSTMSRFAVLSRARHKPQDVRQLEERCQKLLGPLEAAWDGDWYRRAYYDDGTALGSASSREARIDSISQSWAVISGAAMPDRARRAVLSAARELVDEDARIVRLLWPPFDTDRHEPGYIKGYPPGIRENGAQYTHAATWLVWALFEIGENGRANQLFQYLNPITHGDSPDEAQRYVVEPYVLSGDVYSTGTNCGKGGWSWYTGSAAWYWRIGIEELIGCRIRWPYLEIDPRIPDAWPSCHVTLRLDSGSYDIEIVNSEGEYDGVVEVSVDGQPLLYTGVHPRLDLRKPKAEHRVRVVLGRRDRVSADVMSSH